MVLHFDKYFNPEFLIGDRLLSSVTGRNIDALTCQLMRDYAIFTTCYRTNLCIYAASTSSAGTLNGDLVARFAGDPTLGRQDLRKYGRYAQKAGRYSY